MIRKATQTDTPGIIRLISDVFTEYGDQVCLEEGGSESDLLDIQSNFHDRGGCFWVLEIEGRILGTHATLPQIDDPAICGFRRLYLDQSLRGDTDWGYRLMQISIDWARNNGFQRVQFWSDTRFQRAHKFFRKCGFVTDGRIREMHDSHEIYSEYFFELDLKETTS